MSSGKPASALDRKERRRAIGLGVFYFLLAAVMTVVFGIGSASGDESTFRLNPRKPTWEIPDLTVPTRPTVLLLAVVVAVLGGIQLTRGFGRRRGLVLAIVGFLFVFTLLAWAAGGDDFSFVGLLARSVSTTAPLTLGALGGLLCERSGVVNIAIEGMMLAAAFMGAMIGSWAESPSVGLLAAAGIGALLAGLLAVLSIRYRVEQVVGGTVINFLSLALTSYLGAQVLAKYTELNSGPSFGSWEIPLLSDIPLVGPVLFSQHVFVYLAIFWVVFLTFALFRTRWGLRTRSVGEHPKAADTVGIDVYRVRYRNVMLGGAMAGTAGAYFVLLGGKFEENMTGGWGFIALAVLIFGRWTPHTVFLGALLFGFALSLKDTLALLDTPIPSEFLLMLPYLLVLLVVAGVVGRSRPPAADGVPYIKD